MTVVPRVSVGVPVYNGEEYLETALRALQKQTLREFEVIISDNASTDGSRAIAERFAVEDERFHVIGSMKNEGIPRNFNATLESAAAPLFMWNAADDFARPEHLEACCAVLDAHPEAWIAFSRIDAIDAEGRFLNSRDDENLDFGGLDASGRVDLFLRRQVYQVIGFGGVIRTDRLREYGGLPPFYGGDIVLGLGLAIKAPWIQVPRALYVRRMHEGQFGKSQGGDIATQIRHYDPSIRREYAFPQWYLNGRLIAEAAAATIPLSERLRAVASVLRRWTIPNWRFLPFDVKRNMIHLFRGQYSAAGEGGS
ncbi:glycosyltransferase family 2 protein [Planctomonas sp. JC2975]|uniref:glycosyltransferase family 2 protein n=1 Tax=Planctomonas sp. JC2975 TaxID=2729626 RepID=UPI00147421A6|nr:glycosyltransferase family 2 protein [Planctomonas sp. JC2975]NNC11883.1 glycosyltransferase family 2 protein [Planctomonas sp. JC2975]